MRKNFIFLIILIAGCITRGQIFPSADPKISPHNDKERKYCNLCHVGNSVKVYGDPSRLCLRCHPAGKNDHPLGVKLEKDIATWLPLGSEREIVCHTCHDQHNKTQQKSMLRTEFNKLCKECHARK